MTGARHKIVWLFLALALCAQFVLWTSVRKVHAEWINVPPVPSQTAILASAIGDPQLAYRSIGVMLQNLGDMDGKSRSLKEYNYDDLALWFDITKLLDARSDYMPYIASYYFGALDGEPEKLAPLVNYLYRVGNSAEGQKWRWLAHAVYLARFKLENLDLAYKMALDLAALANAPDSTLPNWARQMPAFILNAKGEKEAALAIMVEIISSVGDKLHPNEINHTRGYICEKILSPQEAANNPLCEGEF